MNLGIRWLKFNAVGLLGVGVQLAALALFAKVFRWHYLLATAAAVETAVLHNFVWHELWTWRDRSTQPGSRAARCLRFHLGNGLVSLAANLVFMRLFAGALGIPLMPANLIAITLAALLNFIVSEWWVYPKPPNVREGVQAVHPPNVRTAVKPPNVRTAVKPPNVREGV